MIVEIPFAQFTPDGGRLDNPGLLNADNVAPFGLSHFMPIAAINRLPEATGAADGLFSTSVAPAANEASPLFAIGGAVTFIPATGTGYQVVAGTMSGIATAEHRTALSRIEFAADGTATDAAAQLSESASSIQAEGWFFAVYGNSIVAVAGHDKLPQICLDASDISNVFVQLWSGASTNEPYAKYVAVAGLRLLLGNIMESSVEYPNRVWWSATDDVRFYGTTATDPDKRTGYQDLHDEYGPITGLIGGTDYAYVAKADCWYRMDFGGPFDFQFKPLAIGHGCRFPHSIIKFGDAIYFWGPYGPAVIRGTADPEPLGLGIFARTLKDGTWVQEYGLGPIAGCPPHRMIGFVDAENEIIGWAYNAHNALEEADLDWLWLVDTVFLYNVRHGRGSVIRNLMQTEELNEAGDETGIDHEALPVVNFEVDAQAAYPSDFRPAWPIAVPIQATLDGFSQWSPLLRIHWWMASKGYELVSGGGATRTNTIAWGLGYADNTASPVARFRTGCIAVDPQGGGDGRVSRARLHFSTNVGGEPPEYEVRLLTLTNPTLQPSDPITADKPNDRGWVTFPKSANAPYMQFDVRIKNPHDVGEIEKLEVEIEPAGSRR